MKSPTTGESEATGGRGAGEVLERWSGRSWESRGLVHPGVDYDATGLRTFMGAIGVGPDSAAAQSVLEGALEQGMSTGFVTTTLLADATPAAFGAHAVSRTALGDISRQMATKAITVLMGGGRITLSPQVQPDSSDLLAEVRQSYTYVESVVGIADSRRGSNRLTSDCAANPAPRLRPSPPPAIVPRWLRVRKPHAPRHERGCRRRSVLPLVAATPDP